MQEEEQKAGSGGSVRGASRAPEAADERGGVVVDEGGSEIFLIWPAVERGDELAADAAFGAPQESQKATRSYGHMLQTVGQSGSKIKNTKRRR